MLKIVSRAFALASLALLAACGGSSDSPADSEGSAGSSAKWSDYSRAEEYPDTRAMPEQKVEMSDGVLLSVKLTLPVDAEGKVVETPLPVLLTQTGYNKSIPAIPAVNPFLVRHGYAHLSVDVRGTGLSGGDWEAFSEREQQDYREIMDWIVAQPWSNGRVGTWGASFMGITQLFTAAHQHPAHQAVFAIVPMGDAYRDIVFSGGQVNVGFIPLWMGLVTALGAIPAEPQLDSLPIVLDHVLDAVLNFQVPVIAQAALGVNGQNYDSEFWRTRSPIEQADRIRIPTFIVGGLRDIFQRGEPMLYEAIKDQATTKLLIGPWTHVGAAFGQGLPRDGVPALDDIALRWFDRYLKDLPNGAERLPNVTQYLTGEERYVTAGDWPHPKLSPERWYLRGDRTLSREAPAEGEKGNTALQNPLNGLCSASTAQWTAGLLGLVPLPCTNSDNRINELPVLGEITYTTEVMDQDYYFNGPIQADLFISSTMPDASVVVRVTDVAPNGRSTELTNGILTASLRQVDQARSRFIEGVMIQPWHPYTAESREEVGIGNVVPLAVEVFPTSAVIKQGHRLRITVGASDFPHGLPPVTDLLDQILGFLTVKSEAQYPSSVVLPMVPASAIPPPG